MPPSTREVRNDSRCQRRGASSAHRVPTPSFVTMRANPRLTALLVIAAACSSGTESPAPVPRTVLFTNLLSAEYVGVAFDTITRARFDTSLLVGAASRVCLLFDLTRMGGDVVVELESTDVSGYVFRRAFINVASDSWTWDGATSAASVAPRC